MTVKSKAEVEYRLAKWLLRNLEKQRLITSDEIRAIWQNLIEYYEPPTSCVEIVGGTFGSSENLFKGRVFCGNCGNYYTVRPWHTTQRVWVCRESGKTGHVCRNTHIHDYAFRYQLKEIMLMLLKKHKDVLSICEWLLSAYVKNEPRKQSAIDYLRDIQKVGPIDLAEGREIMFMTERITVFPENTMEVDVVDGKKIRWELKPYSPSRGWWSSRTGYLRDGRKNRDDSR